MDIVRILQEKMPGFLIEALVADCGETMQIYCTKDGRYAESKYSSQLIHQIRLGYEPLADFIAADLLKTFQVVNAH